MGEFSDRVSEWTLIPSGGGVFEVVVDNELVFSKKELDRYAEPGELRELVGAVLS